MNVYMSVSDLRAIGTWELLCGSWQLNPNLLEVQSVLLTPKPRDQGDLGW